MAKLDRFFKALYERQAQELQLHSGRSPAFLFDEGLVPASSTQPVVDQVFALLGEVLDEDTLSQLHGSGEAQGTIERPGLPPLSFKARASASAIEAIFAPADRQTASEPITAPVGETPTEGLPAVPIEAASVPIPVAASEPEPEATTAPVPEPDPATAPIGAPAPVEPETPTAGPAAIDALFRQMIELGASDLHLSSSEAPIVRIDGEIRRMEGQSELSADEIRALLEPITPRKNREEYAESNDTDFAYEILGLARFRANLFRDRLGPGAVFRVIPSKILTAEDLSLSSHILELCMLQRGLVLVTGPTGSGKSTTLTAMIDYINKKRQDHIITIEDPIEFVHENIQCLINQREVGSHTSGFKRALRAALREDPDIVLVGELRDLETIAIAIETAETGHLVFGTLHTTTAISTVDRIIDQFPPDQQAQVRTMLSESLRGVIAQNLCKKIGGGRVAALEVLIGIPSVANLIREGKTFQIPSIMQTGKRHGMVTLNEALVDLVKKGLVTPEEAWRRAADKTAAAGALKAAGCDVSFLAQAEQPAPA